MPSREYRDEGTTDDRGRFEISRKDIRLGCAERRDPKRHGLGVLGFLKGSWGRGTRGQFQIRIVDLMLAKGAKILGTRS